LTELQIQARAERANGYDASQLYDCLEQLYATYGVQHLDPDPLVVVREYSDPRDQEIVGLIAATLAFGGVRQIMKSLRSVLSRMDDSPHTFVYGFDPSRDARRFDGWKHRFIVGDDIASLVWAVRIILEKHGSLGSLFIRGFDPAHRDIGPALTGFVETLRTVDSAPLTRGRFFNHLLSSPRDGSACKRMNLFLRWMVRDSSPDFGLWSGVPTSHLLIPLDTHVARISRNIGLTTRVTVNWRMAQEVTNRLRELDPRDPVKYDYALCRLGILQDCPRKRNLVLCSSCVIRDICVL
jgi:uncharacterized protein (TIGR02757 family)